MGHTATKTGLKPVEVKDGFIDRYSLYEFFEQQPRFKDQKQARRAAGKLLGRLVRLSMPTRRPSHVALRVLCSDCRQTLNTPSCSKKTNPHQGFLPGRNYLVDVESLRLHKAEILAIPLPRDAESFWSDLRLILKHL